jgi:membrane protease YdiL (CAAX protease family)
VSDLTLTDLAAAPAVDTALVGPAPARSRWGFWATTAWGVAVFATMLLVDLAATIAVLVSWGVDESSMPTAAELQSHATIVATAALAHLPVCVAVLMLAVWLARVSVADYLALKRFDAAHLLIGLACTFGYLAAVDIVTYLSGRSMSVHFVQEIYRTAVEGGTLPLLLLGVLVAAPVSEELLFRGFLLRGWSASRLGAVGAVVLTSAIWAVIHTQYDWIIVGQIFGLGLLLGWLRLRSGSTVLSIVLHGAYSAGALVQAAILAG